MDQSPKTKEDEFVVTDKHKLIIVYLVFAIIIGFIGYSIYNIEAMKDDPLTYLEKKMGNDCQVMCSDMRIYVPKEDLKLEPRTDINSLEI